MKCDQCGRKLQPGERNPCTYCREVNRIGNMRIANAVHKPTKYERRKKANNAE